jgi:hypothetical protein
MNPKLFLVAALACLYAGPALATFDILLTSTGIYTSGSASSIAAGTTVTTIGAGTVLLGALGLTIGKALILRDLRARRGKRSAEPLPNISDEQAAAFITSLLDEYRTTMGENYA